MSSGDNTINHDDPNSSSATTNQIALPARLVSSNLNSPDDGDLLLLNLTATGSQGPPIEPPTPAIRQRVASQAAGSVHQQVIATRSSSASGDGTSRSEQKLFTQQQQVAVSHISGTTQRPHSIATNQAASSSYVRTSLQQSSSAQQQQRISTSSLQQTSSRSASIEAPPTVVARQTSASQLVATSSRSFTTQSRTTVSSSSTTTKLLSGASSISGQAITSLAREDSGFGSSSQATIEHQLAGSQGTPTISQQAASRAISSVDAIGKQQLVSIESSSTATAVTRTSRIVKTSTSLGTTSQSLIKNSSSSSSGGQTLGDEAAKATVTTGQVDWAVGQGLNANSGATLTSTSSPLPLKAVWTTSAAERAIASRYLDESFGAMSPSGHLVVGVTDDRSAAAATIDQTAAQDLLASNIMQGSHKETTGPGKAATMSGADDVKTTIQNIIRAPEASSRAVEGIGGEPVRGGKLTEAAALESAGKSHEETLLKITQTKGEQTIGQKSLHAGAGDGSASPTLQTGTSATDINPSNEATSIGDDSERVNNGSDRKPVQHPADGLDQSSSSTSRVNLGAEAAATATGPIHNNWSSDMGGADKIKTQTTLPTIASSATATITKSNVNYNAIPASTTVATTKGTKGASTYLPLPMESGGQLRPYPRKVFFIIVNEFCERFSYYGLRTILVLYFRGVLGFTDANSTVAFHLFAALCYLTPIMGAILADTRWGKFKTILYLSILYFIGELILVLSSIFWNSGTFSVVATILGLTLIAFGTGGIKPCVSTLGGDQFLPHETNWRETFFSIFYGAINLGALASMFITPLVRSNIHCVNRTDCYPVAFGLPCALMLVAIVVFAMAKNRYYLAPLPEKNVLLSFGQCVWLALKRKFSGYKLPPEVPIPMPRHQHHQHHNQSYDFDTSSSNLSVSSNEAISAPASGLGSGSALRASKSNGSLRKSPAPTSGEQQLSAQKMLSYQNGGKLTLDDNLQSSSFATLDDHQQVAADRNHWLYLASDQFDTKCIEDFRSVLGALFLMLPMPVYASLFDQQSSLWTLQATRMDGRIWGTSYILEPDQMSVLNPLLLLVCIAAFQIIIYPSLRRCNVMQSSVQKITVGGLFLALAFVASALIELRIQQHLPATLPKPGEASLLFVNGLSDCSIQNPMISYDLQSQAPKELGAINLTTATGSLFINQPLTLNQIEPLECKGLTILTKPKIGPTINHYRITFKLIDGHQEPNISLLQQPPVNNIDLIPKCQFSPSQEHQLAVEPLGDRAVKLLYLEQGNGKLTYRLFDDSLEMPKSGKARVRLLYEFFGSATLAQTHQFYLTRAALFSNQPELTTMEPETNLKFHKATRIGQVLVSEFMDVDVSARGDSMLLKTMGDANKLIIGNNNNGTTQPYKILLESGTRNLIIVHQNNASNVEVKRQVLQDNQYRVSMLWQLIPYLLLCISEVLFGITCLEFAYSLAPKTMKTILMAAFFTTTAVGNLLTVAIESMHLFSSPVADFLFYAFLMVLSMISFAIMGYYHKPPRLRDD